MVITETMIKLSDLSQIKKMIIKKNLEEKFITGLTDSQRSTYDRAMPVGWAPIDDVCPMYVKAGQLLMPSSFNPVLDLFKLTSKESYNTIYQIFVRLATPESIIKRAAAIWDKNYNRGIATARKDSDNLIVFTVSDLPNFPDILITTTNAHIYSIFEICKRKVNVRTKRRHDEVMWLVELL